MPHVRVCPCDCAPLQAGWVVPTLLFIFCGIWSAWCGLYLTKALQMVRNNRDFSLGIEFSNISKMIFPRWAYLLMLTTLIFNFQVGGGCVCARARVCT